MLIFKRCLLSRHSETFRGLRKVCSQYSYCELPVEHLLGLESGGAGHSRALDSQFKQKRGTRRKVTESSKRVKGIMPFQNKMICRWGAPQHPPNCSSRFSFCVAQASPYYWALILAGRSGFMIIKLTTTTTSYK